MEFKDLSSELLNDSVSLLSSWLPSGKLAGREYECGSVSGEAGKSLKINIDTGRWADFSGDLAGGDLISLYAAINGVTQKQALDALSSGQKKTTPKKRAASPKLIKPNTVKIIPPPKGTSLPNMHNKKLGADPSIVYRYKSLEGAVLYLIARYDHPGGKDFRPYTYTKNGWQAKGWPAPRPLYGLETVNSKQNILIVEGEKSVYAAREFAGKHYAVVTWSGGSKAVDKTDWTPLYGKRSILIWPDHDKPGRSAAASIAKQLVTHCDNLKIIQTADTTLEDGWDAADSGFTWSEFKEWASKRVKLITVSSGEVDAEDQPPAAPMPTEVPDEIAKPAAVAVSEGPFYYTAKDSEKYVPEYLRMAKHCFDKKTFCFDDSTSLKYNGKCWNHLSKTALSNYVMEINEPHIKPIHMDQFIKFMRAKCYIEGIATKSTDGKINLNNGVLDVHTGKLTDHSYKYRFRNCSPVDFTPGAECQRWEEFLLTIFKGNVELMDLAQRMFGYIMIGGDPFLHRSFVLYGGGRNGKSTFIDVLREVLGPDSYAAVSLADLDKKFSVVGLDGVVANIVEETPTDAINSEIFKTAIGGGVLTGSKKFADEYKFTCKARFVFACNDLPVFRDKSVGLEDRLVVMEFPKYFTDEERDTNIGKKLRAELPGIINWAIKGAQIMLKERQIPDYDTLRKSKDLYKKETDPLYAWFYDSVEISTDAEDIQIAEVYARYKNDMQDQNSKPVSLRKFGREFKKLVVKETRANKIYYDPDEQVRINGGRGYKIVKLRGSTATTIHQYQWPNQH